MWAEARHCRAKPWFHRIFLDAMKLLSLLLPVCLLASCADVRTTPPAPEHDDNTGYARSPHEFQSEMLTPAH